MVIALFILFELRVNIHLLKMEYLIGFLQYVNVNLNGSAGGCVAQLYFLIDELFHLSYKPESLTFLFVVQVRIKSKIRVCTREV